MIELATGVQDEALARASLFAAFQAATLSTWGDEGTAQCLRQLSRGALDRTVLIREDWLPERYALEWLAAVWHGPAAREDRLYRRWLRCLSQLQTGRLGRSYARLAGPHRALKHAPTLWRRDHTQGHLTVRLEDNSATVTLTDHPYVESPLAYVALATRFRHAALTAGAHDVRVTRAPSAADTLSFDLSWR